MAEQIEVEFDLDPAAMADLMTRKHENVRQVVSLTLCVVAGAAMVALGQVGLGVFFLVFILLIGLLIWKMPKIRRSLALRLAGHTEIRFSDEGMDFRGANVAERVQWARIRGVYDRPELWSVLTKAPTATFIVPKSAVPAATRERFAAQLKDWSGAAYKVRKQ